MLADAHPTEKTTIIGAGSLVLGNQPDKDAYSTFSVIDLEGQMLLPKHVCFKGDNGKYLMALGNSLLFSSDDIGDPLVRNIIETNSDGTIRIQFCEYRTFWMRGISGNAIEIYAGSVDRVNADSMFRALLLERGGKCALQNLGNNNFCNRDLTNSLICAAVQTITREAQLELHETVLSRRIYSVEYHLDDVNISGLKPRDYFIKTIDNTTDRPQKSKIAIGYDVTTETRWDSSVSLKLGVTTTIKAGVPLLTEASVEISYEFSGSYSWGETKSETKKYSSEEEVEVAAHTELTLRVVATEGTCDIPFTYTQEDILTTGETIVTNLGDGIYRGVNSYGFKTVISEKKI
jgi:hypothetical protein